VPISPISISYSLSSLNSKGETASDIHFGASNTSNTAHNIAYAALTAASKCLSCPYCLKGVIIGKDNTNGPNSYKLFVAADEETVIL